jgi:2'-5' RNA ligase
LRLFVALDLPAAVRFPAPAAPWRAVPREKQHVTLVFLGDCDEPPALELAPPVAPLRVETCITLPPRRPRVLAVRLADPTGALTAYQRVLAEALDHVEERPWLPHVTIGRTRERIRRDAPLPEVEPVELVAPTATLYRSAGGRYEPLARLSAQS